MFPGQGGQWPGMAVELMDSSPVFAEHMRGARWRLRRMWTSISRGFCAARTGQPTLEPVQVVQPVLFAVMVSLAELWRSFGVEPAAVVGHSQGEIAAAHIAGGLSLEDAARIVAVRSRAVARIEGGGMMSVALPVDELERRARELGVEVSVAAVNGPASLIVSGDPAALDELGRACEADGVRARRIAVSYAALTGVEALRDELLEGVAGIEPRAGEALSVLDGDGRPGGHRGDGRRVLVPQPAPDGAVRARGAGDGAGGDRHADRGRPHPVLTAPALETLESELGDAGEAAALGSLRRDEGGLDRFVGSLAEAHVHGVQVD